MPDSRRGRSAGFLHETLIFFSERSSVKKLLLLALLTLCAGLTGCAAVVNGVGNAAIGLKSLLAQAEAQTDVDMAHWVSRPYGIVSLRARSLESMPRTGDALRSACQAGRSVEVLVFGAPAQAAATLRGSCVRVYASDNPDMARSPSVLLLDGVKLVSQGHVLAASDRDVRQEYQFRQYVKASATRVN